MTQIATSCEVCGADISGEPHTLELYGRPAMLCQSCACLEEISVAPILRRRREEARTIIQDYVERRRSVATDPRGYIMALIESFPCLQGKMESVPQPFDGQVFARRIRPWSSGEKHCAHFVLNVWNPGEWAKGETLFNLFDAIGCLDRGNLRPIVEWMSSPMWP
jgi:hypothetical protein